MAPKTTRNSGDKLDGSKMTRVGRDKGDLAGANRCPTSTTGKPIGKNMSGPGKDAKTSDSATPLLELVAETIPLDACSEKTLIESNKPLIKAIQGSEDLLGARDSSTVIREKECGPLTGKEQLQVQPQAQRSENQTRVGATSVPSSTLGIEELQKISSNPKGWNKAVEKDLKSSDWAKDSSDKFYSLTEESDLSSGEHSFSESGSSETSETGNKSSSNEPTVRQWRRQRKCTKIQPGPQEGLEIPTSTGGRTLKFANSCTEIEAKLCSMDERIGSRRGR
ncbi:hypothetical protein NDU88_001524 [Pleurodeles waltl]|uniref:Uncharacterized protein n=1 Tax=Pleurodeles waltl TaxID=8319 RepID=A0AAV7UX09_PLEWA|nr:hypothetical protein NDU88_001524 [Pleurodeles waltl]